MRTRDHELEPVPYWQQAAEKLLTVALILAFGVPVAIYTGSVYWAAGAGVVGVTLVQVVYWRVYRGVPLSEVYRALRPWVGGGS